MEKIIGLKELRKNVETYVAAVRRGESFIVVRWTKPVFKLTPPDEEEMWETVVDFTKIREGGAPAEEILARL